MNTDNEKLMNQEFDKAIGPNVFIPSFLERALNQEQLMKDPEFVTQLNELQDLSRPDEDIVVTEQETEFMKEFEKFQNNFQSAQDMVEQLMIRLERIADIQNQIIEAGHEITPDQDNFDPDKPIGEILNNLQQGLEEMKEEGVEISDGKPDLKQMVFEFKEGKQLSLYGIIYRIVKVFPLAIELKKESDEKHIQKLKAGDVLRIYGLPYKILSTATGGKVKIENKKYEF